MTNFVQRSLCCGCAFAAFFMAVAAMAAEPARPVLGNADKSQLVIGDWYEVTIEHGSVKRNEEGHLLKVTDDWLVLGCKRVAAESTRVPWIGDLPYVGALFQTTTTRGKWCIYWVPRNASTIRTRTMSEDKSYIKDFSGLELKFENCKEIVSAEDDGKIRWIMSTEGVTLADGKVQFTQIDADKVRSKPKGWRSLPVVNTFTAQERTVFHKRVQDVPLDEVLCVSYFVPVDGK